MVGGPKPEGMASDVVPQQESIAQRYKERAELATKWWDKVTAEGKQTDTVKVAFGPLYPKSNETTTLRDRIPLNQNDEEAKETVEEVTNQEIHDAGLMISDGGVQSAGNPDSASGLATDLTFGIVENETE